MHTTVKHSYEFGPFQLDPKERLLLQDGRPISLTPKAFDLLVVLVESSGHLVERTELLKAVWQGSVVEEQNLSVTISFLRKALSDDRDQHRYIETVSKRGYRFVAEVREVGEAATSSPHPPAGLLEVEPERIGESRLPSRLFALGSASEVAFSWRVWSAALVLAVSLIAFVVFPRRAVTSKVQETQIHSLAVLPFQTLGVKHDDEYLGVGMADALITRLGNTGKIVVRPTTSIQKYAERGLSPQAAGIEQGVDAVIDGSIQREEDRVRLTVQLVRVRDGAQLWGEVFDEGFTNIFGLEDVLSERVAQSISLKLTGEQARRLTKRSTTNPDAYEAYVKGRYFWNKRTAKGIEKGLQYFRQAIALDPSFAEAYVGVADSYSILAFYAVLPPRDAFPIAKEATERALQLDDGLPEAHTTLGFIHFYYDWNGFEATREFQRSLADNPNYATAHSWFGVSLAARGQYSEADAEARRALEEDPLSPIIGSNAGWAVSLSGNPDQAIDILKKTIEIDPNFPRAHLRLGRAYEQKKQYDLAIAELEKAVSLSEGEPCYKGSLGHVYALSGRTEQAKQVLKNLQNMDGRKYVPAYAIALVYAGLGDNDHAISWLQKAYDDRSTGMAFLRTDPELAGLRSDPRFEELSRRISF